MLAFFLIGLGFGFTAGISPGPMLGLVIRETLEHGWRAGCIIALAPLLTDVPVIGLALLLIGAAPSWLVTGLGLIGGVFVIWLGIDTLRSAPPTLPFLPTTVLRGSLWRGLLTNWLNPHPWIFWITVGVPQLIMGWRQGGIGWPLLFLSGFYALLVGSKVLLASLVHGSRRWLHGAAYRWVLRGSGVLLIGLGVLLILQTSAA